MVEIRFKHDQMKVSPDGVANNRGDPPRLFGARGDPSSGGKRAPTMVSNALSKPSKVIDPVILNSFQDHNSLTDRPRSRFHRDGVTRLAMPKRYPLLPIKNRDRLSALASLRATVGSAAICRPIGNNNNKMKKDCVRLDDSPEVSLADFRCEGVSRGREGFHRAPEMMRTASLRATVGSAAICQNDSVRVDCFVLLRRPRNDDQTTTASLRP